MHVNGVLLDLKLLLQIVFILFVIALTLLYLVKSTASKYFEVDANFEGVGRGSDRVTNTMPGIRIEEDRFFCAVCDSTASKWCSRCKSIRYCSLMCQTKDWNSGHKRRCNQTATSNNRIKLARPGVKLLSEVALVPTARNSCDLKKPKKVLFPYAEFVQLFKWDDNPGFPPCGLLNIGNNCFANVVLQCLTCTRPLFAYLMEKGHKSQCRRNDWCFLCDFQDHVERASMSRQPFSPISILSQLPNIGGNFGHGRQEDAHEFMRFAIDTMQSVCLDEYGGEKTVHPSSQETTVIQHIFGGHFQSQVICTNCDKVSYQYENMMDLTVEIHGDAASLEECLEQFTVKEWLHGENMYKCDGCNDYVKAWKRLTIRHAPNILTIALKRFQSGRFGKLNKRVTFSETLDLSPYMNEETEGSNIYKLYAVVVHLDMLNASYFGHYICYVKDLRGRWYRIDDCKVTNVDLDEVLSQAAYMLLYSRVQPRVSCLLKSAEFSVIEEHNVDKEAVPAESLIEDGQMMNGKGELSPKKDVGYLSMAETMESAIMNGKSELFPKEDVGYLSMAEKINPPYENGVQILKPSTEINSEILTNDEPNAMEVADSNTEASTSESLSSVQPEDMDVVSYEASQSLSESFSQNVQVPGTGDEKLQSTAVMNPDSVLRGMGPVKVQDLKGVSISSHNKIKIE